MCMFFKILLFCHKGDYQNLAALSPVAHPTVSQNHRQTEEVRFRFDHSASNQPIESTPGDENF